MTDIYRSIDTSFYIPVVSSNVYKSDSPSAVVNVPMSVEYEFQSVPEYHYFIGSNNTTIEQNSIAVSADGRQVFVYGKGLQQTVSPAGTGNCVLLSEVTPIVSFAASSMTFSSSLVITMSADNINALIYYTTNGSVPTTGSASITNGQSVTVSATSTVRAKAIVSGGRLGEETYAVYSYDAIPIVLISPANTTFNTVSTDYSKAYPTNIYNAQINNYDDRIILESHNSGVWNITEDAYYSLDGASWSTIVSQKYSEGGSTRPMEAMEYSYKNGKYYMLTLDDKFGGGQYTFVKLWQTSTPSSAASWVIKFNNQSYPFNDWHAGYIPFFSGNSTVMFDDTGNNIIIFGGMYEEYDHSDHDYFVVFHSHDAGETWAKSTLGSYHTINLSSYKPAWVFKDGVFYVGTAGNGYIFISTDLGSTFNWYSTVGYGGTLRNMSLANGYLYATASNQDVVRSTDGINWSFVNSGIDVNYYSPTKVVYDSVTSTYTYSNGAFLYVSSNGSTWTKISYSLYSGTNYHEKIALTNNSYVVAIRNNISGQSYRDVYDRYNPYGPTFSVSLSANEPSTIYYTTNNSAPTTGSSSISFVSTPVNISISATSTVRAIAKDSVNNLSIEATPRVYTKA